MKVYIDFDGVILYTTKELFNEWLSTNYDINIKEKSKIKYIISKDWEYILKKSPVIDEAIKYLREMDPDKTAILTKIHSLENEGAAKVRFLRNALVKQEVVLVPYTLSKTDVVSAKGNYLIDDTIHNLDKWTSCGGNGIFFNKDDCDEDEWHDINTKYPKIKTLKYVNNLINMKE